LRLEAKIGAAGAVGAQQIAGGYLGYAVLGDEQLGLRPLADTGGA